MWLAETNGNSKQKKGEASCTCSDPRGSSTMVKQGAADASQKPIDPSSLSITEGSADTADRPSADQASRPRDAGHLRADEERPLTIGH